MIISKSVQTQTCLRTSVGRWRNNMCAYPTVSCSTGVSSIIASVATLAFRVMTLIYSSRAALFTLVRVLVDKGIPVWHCISRRSAVCLHNSGIFVLLCSPRYSPQSLPSWDQPREAGLRCCYCCFSWWACHCQRMDCHLQQFQRKYQHHHERYRVQPVPMNF